MFPRIPRLLRLALLVVLLSLSLLFVLRAGGDQRGHPNHHHHPSDLLRLRPSPLLQGHPLLAASRQSHTAPPKARVPPSVYRNTHHNRTVVAASAESKTTARDSHVVNPHPFAYLINPRHACRAEHGRRVEMLVYVHSAPANFKKRMSIRQTWGEQDVLAAFNATLVFIMGMVPDTQLTDLVHMESERFGDVVQEDFLDSYRNLTYKAIAGLKWAAGFCPGVSYILKTDDDILVNMPRVVRHIQHVVRPQYGTQRLILCNQWVRMKIIRDTKSKWYIPEKDLKGDYFSPYCSGSAFILSGDMARLLYEASLVTPFFWVDDFYITGELVQHLGIKHRSLNKAYSLNPAVAESKYHNDASGDLFFFHLHKLRLMYNLWRNMSAVIGGPATTARALGVTRSRSVLPVARAA
ncbi:beta-1,3-galactosyltransferase 1-like [Babylonia areolata]|uniref:beta-1,3-galactosyltransferase 1-like n=1 Tax=Babylonia areolata TaxID=304850 RepID=UPI003FCF5B2B